MPSIMSSVLLLLLALFSFLHTTSADQQAGGQQAGVNRAGVTYGTFGNNLPTAQEAISLVKAIRTQRLRLYGPDHYALQALRNTGIEVVLGVPNNELQSVASSQAYANKWIQNNVKNYQDVNFRYIVVGNGVSSFNEHNGQYAQFLLQALQNIQNAVSASGLQNKVKVSTALDHSVVLKNIHPPSKAEFDQIITQYFVYPVINFLKNNNSPLLVNLHPYYSYAFNKPEIPQELNKDIKQTSRDIRLEYANFRSPTVLVQDGPFAYVNVFDAMVDAVYWALEKAGASSVDVVVSETGWPSAGGAGASEWNAGAYVGNLISHIKRNGTPKRPQNRVETYVYNLLDENQKSQEVERHFGIFEANKRAKFPISFWSPNE